MQQAEVDRAARNNARWCDAVCRAHGITARFGADAWTSPRRTPALFPDAVTLRPDVAVAELLSQVDASDGCSIKDSFAELDLSPAGFEILFEAEWIRRDPPARREPSPASPRWRPVSADELPRWERAWAGSDGPAGIFVPEVLTDRVVVLGEVVDGQVRAGAVTNRDDGVVGLSNVFGPEGELDRTWTECLRVVDACHPDSIVVGYESADSLDAAHRHGFRSIGPVRIWQR